MHFSCKISNSIISYLEQQDEDIGDLYESSPIPLELLRDPSCWISAHDMERVLEYIQQQPWRHDHQQNQLFTKAGHAVAQTRSWGVLDSVLRMMPRPQEIFNQPARFLGYFISPEPPVENLQKSEIQVAFDLPLPAEQYPLVSSYLKASFEALPNYVGLPLATCTWSGLRIQLSWSNTQSSLLEKDLGMQLNPNLLQSVVDDLQKHQQDLEVRNKELQLKLDEMQSAYREIQERIRTKAPLLLEESQPEFLTAFDSQSPGHLIGQNLGRLHDYMVRAQQLITLLAGQGKLNPAVKEAMRRMDWDFVKAQYPRAISESVEALRKMHSDGIQAARKQSQSSLNSRGEANRTEENLEFDF